MNAILRKNSFNQFLNKKKNKIEKAKIFFRADENVNEFHSILLNINPFTAENLYIVILLVLQN